MEQVHVGEASGKLCLGFVSVGSCRKILSHSNTELEMLNVAPICPVAATRTRSVQEETCFENALNLREDGSGTSVR